MLRRPSIIAIVILFAMPIASFGFDSALCRTVARMAAAQITHPLHFANDLQKQFIDAMMEVTGLRTLQSAPDTFRPIEVGPEGMVWIGYDGGLSARLVFTDETSPRTSSTKQERVLHLPRTFASMEPLHFRAELQRWLLGHPLHPFIKDSVARHERESLKEDSLLLKEAQSEAMDVSDHYLESFHNEGNQEKQRLLIAAPTGTGKTEILKANLLKALALRPNGVHVIVADQVGLVGQLHDDLSPLAGPKNFKLFTWGAEGTAGGPKTIAQLEKLSNTGGTPIVLITTIQSLMSQLGVRQQKQKANPHALARLRGVMRHFIYDEVHHGSGELRSDIIRELLDNNPEASATGITATPTPGAVEIFGNHAFYTYLDKPETFIAEPNPAIRSVGDAVLQLQRALRAGELVGFGTLKMIAPKTPGGGDVFIMERTGEANRAVVNPEYYSYILKAIVSVAHNKQGIIIANTEAETIRIQIAFTEVFGPHGRVAEVVTYKTITNAAEFREVRKRFNDGVTHVLISVQKLDEGIDLPNASYYVDLNRNIQSREFLQRVGRTTRVAPRKTKTEVFVLTPKTQAEVVEGLSTKTKRRKQSIQNEEDVEVKSEDLHEERPNGFEVDAAVPIVSWDTRDLFDLLRETNIETLNFWESSEQSRNSLEPDEHILFNAESGMRNALTLRFRGSANKTKVWVDGLATALPELEQQAFRERHRNLGSHVTLSNARDSRPASYEVITVLADFARILNEAGRLAVPISRADLLLGETLTKLLAPQVTGTHNIGNPLASAPQLNPTDHARFSASDGMLTYLRGRFEKISLKSTRLVDELALLLPEVARESFKVRHGNLGNDEIVNKAGKRPEFAGRLVELIEDWAKIQVAHGNLSTMPTRTELLTETTGTTLFGSNFSYKLKLTKDQHQIFSSKGGMLEYLKQRFVAGRIVQQLADLLPGNERELFLARHPKFSADAIGGSVRSLGSASTVVALLVDWTAVQHKQGQLTTLPTLDSLLLGNTGRLLFGAE